MVSTVRDGTDGATTVSSVEVVKAASNHLRGDLAQELASESANVGEDSEQLLKFHGIYAQDNRDVRRERTQSGQGLEYVFMIRVVVPGGQLTSRQWLALDEVATTVADGSIRLTTRQAVQFHGVTKGNLRTLARRIDEVYLSSFGGCGDVVRNVVVCPALGLGDDVDFDRGLASALREAFRSSSSAHWEIFVAGDKVASREEVERPFYGETYLPRKFKIAVAHPHENCVDVFAQDVGLIPANDPRRGPGFTLVVGGGLGRSYAQPDTFAQLAQPMCFVERDRVRDVVAAIVEVYRDWGERGNRRRARLKYVIADGGLARFRDEVQRRLGYTLDPPFELPSEFTADDHLGWSPSPSGRWRLGLHVGAGRVRDDVVGAHLRRALAQIARLFDVTFAITAQQNLVIADVPHEGRTVVEAVLADCAVRPLEVLGAVERHALACPALPTCSQALAESERRLPDLVDAVEGEMGRRGVAGRPVQLRLTGCPNGCARPAVAEIGVVGRTKSTYDLYLGGSPRGDRLARLYLEKVKLDDVASVVGPLMERWGREGAAGETFGDFVTRSGVA